MVSSNYKFIERRKGPDIWVKLLTWMSFVGWLIVAAILAIIAKVSPKMETFFDRLLEVEVNRTVDEELAKYAFYLMIGLFIISVTGIIINSRRHRRKTDRYRISLIVMSIFSVAGIIIYLLPI